MHKYIISETVSSERNIGTLSPEQRYCITGQAVQLSPDYPYEDDPKKSYYERLKEFNGNLVLTVEKEDQLTQNINMKSQRVIELLNNTTVETQNKIYEDEILIGDKQRIMEELNTEINKISSIIGKDQQEIQEQTLYVIQLEKEELIITNEINMLNKKILPRIQHELEKNVTAIKMREENLIELNKKKDTISKRIQFIELVFKPFLNADRKDRIQSSLRSISSEVDMLEVEINDLINSNITKEAEISLLKNQYLEMYSKLKNLKDEKREKITQIKEIEHELSLLVDNKLVVEDQTNDCNINIQRANNRIDNYKARIVKDQERLENIAFYTTKLIKKEFTIEEGAYYLEELNKNYGYYRRRTVGSVGSIEGKLLTREHFNYFNDKIENVSNIPNLITVVNDFIENNDICISDEQSKLRLRLVAATIFKGKSDNKKITLIDEAQDFSVIDFEILNFINSDEGICINFFGDSQQNINLTHESNWDMLMRNFSVKMFKLNENYRNSVEITKYYNKRMERNDLSIGISSGPIIEALCIKEAIEQLIACPNYRKVIVIKSINSAISKNITTLLGNKINVMDYSAGIDFTRINLLSVQSVKGMEFDTALVITNDLTKNEEYVALTRALHKLIVYRV